MTNGIYPVEWAEMTKERAGQKYQPSNGTEGELFMACWCGKCARDKAMREEIESAVRTEQICIELDALEIRRAA